MDQILPLRERKKYQTMTTILEAFLNSLESSTFDEIRVEDICRQVSISKVTFFRYFNSKEAVLDYFVMRWCYQRSIEIHSGAYHGIEGIRHVFRSATNMPNAEKILVAIIHYYSKLKEPPVVKELSEYERYVISQNAKEGIHIEVLSIGEIFHSYLVQIESLFEPAKLSKYNQHMLALFFGIPFQVYIQMLGVHTLEQAYMDGLELLFGAG